ncbi:MAG: tol-pal system protein YbgF [Deltaproteobacteria bacterium]|nr:MAG: tol-pal system protein YbgF [Deltaproteobacteria bacterium]
MVIRGLKGWLANLQVVSISVLMTVGCATQQDLVTVNNRVIAIEKRVARQEKTARTDRDALRSDIQSYREEQLKADEAYRIRHAELHSLMEDLREEIADLRGQIENSRYDMRRRTETLALSQEKNEQRLKALEESLRRGLDRIIQLEQYLGMEPSGKVDYAEATPPGLEKGKTKLRKTPDELYTEAKQQLDSGKYESARELFLAFLKQYPKSENADNAQFWIGEIYYREKWYEKAILEYQKVIENYPKGNKIRSALLKQGFAFFNLGDKTNARLILKELVRKYPRSNEAKIARKKLKVLE